MEFDEQSLRLGHLLLSDRKCRVCGEEKNLIEGFYRSRKESTSIDEESLYSKLPYNDRHQ